MNETKSTVGAAPIRPEVLAGKMAAIRNLEYPDISNSIQKTPRLVELLWFIQAMSLQPGGLKSFTEGFLKRFPERIGTASMHAFGVPQNGRYSLGQTDAIWREIPKLFRDKVEFFDDWRLELALGKGTDCRDCQETIVQENLYYLDYERLQQFCRKAASEDLPRFLAALCNEVSQGFSERWYFRDIISCLVQAMDHHAADAKKHLAMTQVAVKSFDALDYALSENGMVQIEGDSRFGKTEAIKTWCAARPGLARLVQVPCSNSEGDLYKAIADAIGIQYGLGAKSHDLKERIEYILRHGNLMLVFDEAQFLLPTRFSKTTPPMRLNWVRTQIVDKKLPVALCFTPQSYKQALTAYLKATSYAIEQFIGRTLMKVVLPKELSKSDLIAVSKIHFPEFDSDFLELISAKARQSESYLMAVEAIAKRVRYIARRNNRSEITLEDVDLALSEIMPTVNAPAPIQAKKTDESPSVNRRNISPVTRNGRCATPLDNAQTEARFSHDLAEQLP